MPTSFAPTRLQVVSGSKTTADIDTTSADAIWINYADSTGKWVLSSGVILKSGKKLGDLGLDLAPKTVGGKTVYILLKGGEGVEITGVGGASVKVALGEMVILKGVSGAKGSQSYPYVIRFKTGFARFDVIRPADVTEKVQNLVGTSKNRALEKAMPLGCTGNNCPHPDQHTAIN